MDGSAEMLQIQEKKMQDGMSHIEYKGSIIDVFKSIEDPFGIEIENGVMDYEQNPSEPTKPQKTVQVSPYEPVKWE